MTRIRLRDFRLSDAATDVGICQGDIASVAALVNSAQRRLIFAAEAGDSGWWGSWARMVFNVQPGNPYLTLPRGVARLQSIDVCQRPVPIQNEFYEFLQFGSGLQPRQNCCTSLNGSNCQFLQGYDRGAVPSFVDLSPTNQTIRVYLGDASDEGKRVLIQGEDVNGNVIQSQDGLVLVQGQFLTLEPGFVQLPFVITKLTGLQKDITNFPVQFFQVDMTTGNQQLLVTMEPGEEVASYRRYLLNGLPNNCCSTPGAGTVQVTAMAKLELIPAKVDPDYLLIQNLEALAEECSSIRFSKLDSLQGAQQAKVHHKDAIRLLNGELAHYLGVLTPAVNEKPFGNATLRRQSIGQMI